MLVTPEIGCHELGDPVVLTFVNLDDVENRVQTNFQLVSGVGTVTEIESDTISFTSNDTTNATILASATDNPGISASTTVSFGCQDFSVKVIEGSPEADPWTMSYNLGESDGITFSVPGKVSDDGETIRFEFTATTHRNSVAFQVMQFAYQRDVENYNLALNSFQNGNGENPGMPPNEPKTGDIGLYFYDTFEEYNARADQSPFNNSEYIYNVPNFNFTISFKYRRELGAINIPGIFETSNLTFIEPPTVTINGGPAGTYRLDPLVSVSEAILNGNITYEIFFVPSDE